MSYEALSKNPGYVRDLSQLKPGDILLFRPSLTTTVTQRLIKATGEIKDFSGGHADTTHAAIVTKMVNGKPWIAHLTAYNKVMGYKNEPLLNMIDRDGNDRAFLVFSSKDDKVASDIAKYADDDRHTDITWSKLEAAKVIILPPKLSADRVPTRTQERMQCEDKTKSESAKSSFCSRFVANVIKTVVAKIKDSDKRKAYKLNIQSVSLPAILEGELNRNGNFKCSVYPGKVNPYEYAKGLITKEIERLELKKHSNLLSNSKLVSKRGSLSEKYQSLTKELDKANHMDDLTKSRVLLKILHNELAMNTGLGIRMASTYKNVILAAEKRGIFVRNRDGKQIEPTVDSFLNSIKKTQEAPLVSDVGNAPEENKNSTSEAHIDNTVEVKRSSIKI